MKKIITLSFILSSYIIFSQDINRLKENNGFRDIKLGSDVGNYPGFKKQTPKNKNLFSYWPDYEYIYDQKNYKGYDKINNADIYRIFVKTFENKIYQIFIITEKKLEIIESLKLAYGNPNWDNLNADYMWWKTDTDIECNIMGRGENKNNILINYVDNKIWHLAFKKEQENKIKKAISEF